jgi:SAM-dependent methyltransferase
MTPSTLSRAINSIKWRELAFTYSYCPVCSAKRIIVRLRQNEIAIRCLTCRATVVTMSLVAVLRQLVPDLPSKEVYELSSRGPLVNFLKENCGKLTCSEYLDGVKPGDYQKNIQCQDVQKLTFPDNSFDICTSTEVFEHVPNDLAGFSEIRRVLRPGGLFLFTVPLFKSPTTVERAQLNHNQKIEHLLPAQYHGDPIRNHHPVLVFRDYGKDITQRVINQGFSTAQLLSSSFPAPWHYSRLVITAFK